MRPHHKEKDGSSPDKAIIVESIKEEYQWISCHCSDWYKEIQMLKIIDGKPYDVQPLYNDQGEERTVYFDISKFYKTR